MTTTRMLIAAAIFAAMLVGGMIYYRYSGVRGILNIPVTDSKQSLTGGSVEGRVTTIEDALVILINRVNNLSPTTPQTAATPNQVSGDINSRVQSLENTVANLQVQINQLKGGETALTGSSVRPPSFIPLGTGGSVNSRDWVSVGGYQVTIDSADYPGYSGVYLEVNMRLSEPKATKAYARLYNTTNNSAASGEASTTATAFSLATTSSFQLSPGKKTYTLQVKSTDTGEIFIQDARIKVTF